MRKNIIHYIAALFGVMLAGIGLYFVKVDIEPQGIMKVLPYICIGLGCGIFGQGMGEIIRSRVLKNNPDIEKQINVSKNDERNIAIGNYAKAKAYDAMIFVFGAVILVFALMQVSTSAVLILVFAYLFVIGYGIYYRCKFDKEM